MKMERLNEVIGDLVVLEERVMRAKLDLTAATAEVVALAFIPDDVVRQDKAAPLLARVETIVKTISELGVVQK